MAGTVPVITSNPNNITGMTCLEDRPVFFLNLNGSMVVNLVVKGEGDGVQALAAHAPESIKWGAKLMKGVNNTLVNTKIMTPDEILGFKIAGLQMIPAQMARPRVNLQTPGPPYTWTKMPFVTGLSSAEFWNEDDTPDANKAKVAIAKLSDEAFWTDLGKVVAVDIFNGNCDRFDITNGFWQNKGNIMFLAGGATSAIGLDTFDPNATELHDLNAHVDFSNIQTRIKFQHLLYLTDPGERLKFAKVCLKSVGTELKRAFKNVGHFTVQVQGPQGNALLRVQVDQMSKLFEDYVTAFEQGIAAGALALKQRLQSKVRQYRPVVPFQRAQRGGQPGALQAPVVIPGKVIPQGILDRMAYLKWSV